MTYFWRCYPFLSLLFILSCLDSGICLGTQQKRVLKSLFNSSSPSNNASSGDPCNWSGVNCIANNVTKLHMSSFGLKGNTWQMVCQLPALQVLDVPSNALSTPSDNDIKACTSLVSLNISSNFMPGSLPSLAWMHKLQYLDVSYNKLGNDFCPQIQILTDLRVLNLIRNQFTGSIPSLLGFQVKLEKLYLSHNIFAGEFTSELVNCINLDFLDLSFNMLKGNIPDSIGSFSNLRVVNVSANTVSI